MIGRAGPASGGLTEQLLGLGDSPWWWFAALCAQTDPELFFPEKVGLHHAGRPARRIATQLGVHERQVGRWLSRHRAGKPVCPAAGRRPGPRRCGAGSGAA